MSSDIATISDEVVEMWKHMPLMFAYDRDRREYVGIKNYHINDGGTRLTEHLSVPKDLVDAAVRRHGKDQGIKIVREKMHDMINKRIEKNYKGKNLPIPTE